MNSTVDVHTLRAGTIARVLPRSLRATEAKSEKGMVTQDQHAPLKQPRRKGALIRVRNQLKNGTIVLSRLRSTPASRTQIFRDRAATRGSKRAFKIGIPSRAAAEVHEKMRPQHDSVAARPKPSPPLLRKRVRNRSARLTGKWAYGNRPMAASTSTRPSAQTSDAYE
eukprot:31772-Pleurochrysis_carterae.AAC.9